MGGGGGTLWPGEACYLLTHLTYLSYVCLGKGHTWEGGGGGGGGR